MHNLSRTDVTVQDRMVGKSPYAPIGIKIHDRCYSKWIFIPSDEIHEFLNNEFQLYLHTFWVFVTVIPAISNDNTLALTRSKEPFCRISEESFCRNTFCFFRKKIISFCLSAESALSAERLSFGRNSFYLQKIP